jgi:hypothetical protein
LVLAFAVTTPARWALASVTGGVRTDPEKYHFLLFSRLPVRQDSPALAPRLETSLANCRGCDDQERATGGIAGIAAVEQMIVEALITVEHKAQEVEGDRPRLEAVELVDRVIADQGRIIRDTLVRDG